MFETVKKIAGYPIYRSPYNKRLEGKIQELWRVVDVLSGTAVEDDNDMGNTYKEKTVAVNAIYSKYQNMDTWGCQFVQRIINQRKALVMPYGIDTQLSDQAIKEKDKGDDEMTFIRRFLDFNDFNEGREDDLCRYAEMEGQMLVTLDWNEAGDGEGGLPKVKRISWHKNHYEIESKSDDDDEIATITWNDSSSAKQRTLTAGDLPFFVFVAFNDVDFIGTPTISLVLNECESLHQALGGWRKTNKYFAKITPFFKVETWKEAKAVMAWLKAEGWKVGSGVAAKGFEMVGPSTAPAESLYEEIKTRVQVISGATGIPIHYLGFADVLKNRACYSEDTETLTESGWKFYHEIGPDEKIACYDPDTASVVYRVPDDLLVYDYDGEMVHFDSDNTDILVTPDHKMWVRGVQDGPSREWHKEEAQNITDGVTRELVCAADWNEGVPVESIRVGDHDSKLPSRDGQVTSFSPELFLKFLGYYVSEGGVCWTVESEKVRSIIHLGQNEGPVAESMKSCLRGMGLKFNAQKSYDGQERIHICHSGLAEWLVDGAGKKCSEKRIPDNFRNAPKDQLRILFDALMEGDGYWDPREGRTSGYYSTTSSLLADHVQEIAFKLGYSAIKGVHYEAHGNRRTCYRVNLCGRKYRQISARHGHVSRLFYSGKVYCFATPTGLFVTRRNGKIAIQGNTALTLTEPMEMMALSDVLKWKGFYEQLFDKAITLRNSRLNGQLQTGIVKPKMAPVTDRQFDRLVNFWLPAREDNLVSAELFAQQIPGNIDVQEELKRLNQQQLGDLFERGADEATQELFVRASRTQVA